METLLFPLQHPAEHPTSTVAVFKPYCLRETLQQSPNGPCPCPTITNVSAFSSLLLPSMCNIYAQIVLISHFFPLSLSPTDFFHFSPSCLCSPLSACFLHHTDFMPSFRSYTQEQNADSGLSACRAGPFSFPRRPILPFRQSHWRLPDTHKVCCDTRGLGVSEMDLSLPSFTYGCSQ